MAPIKWWHIKNTRESSYMCPLVRQDSRIAKNMRIANFNYDNDGCILFLAKKSKMPIVICQRAVHFSAPLASSVLISRCCAGKKRMPSLSLHFVCFSHNKETVRCWLRLEPLHTKDRVAPLNSEKVNPETHRASHPLRVACLWLVPSIFLVENGTFCGRIMSVDKSSTSACRLLILVRSSLCRGDSLLFFCVSSVCFSSLTINTLVKLTCSPSNVFLGKNDDDRVVVQEKKKENITIPLCYFQRTDGCRRTLSVQSLDERAKSRHVVVFFCLERRSQKVERGED